VSEHYEHSIPPEFLALQALPPKGPDAEIPETVGVTRANGGTSGFEIPPTWQKPSANRDGFRDVRRIPIRFPRLDASWDGGVEIPRLIVAQGPATSGKSGFAAQLVVELARQGALGIYVPADQGVKPAKIRMGGIMGLDPKILKNGKHPGWAAEWDRFDRYCAELGLWITPDNEPIESVVERIEHLSRFAPERIIALAVDSIHTVAHESAADTRREQIEHVVGLLTSMRERLPLFGIAVSEVVKSAYRSKKPGENSDPLSAAAESRAIAHAADTILHFSGNPATEAEIHVPKNRDSEEVRFTFSVQARQNRLVEVDGSEAAKAREQKKVENEEKERAELGEEILDLHRKVPGRVLSNRATATELFGSPGGRGYQKVRAAYAMLAAQRAVVYVDDAETSGWKVA
jgi:KaiC/GvpD/RAD55 family RecA-like ATPase